MSYQKKDGHGHTGSSFFWYDNDSGHEDLLWYLYIVTIVLIFRYSGQNMLIIAVFITLVAQNVENQTKPDHVDKVWQQTLALVR